MFLHFVAFPDLNVQTRISLSACDFVRFRLEMDQPIALIRSTSWRQLPTGNKFHFYLIETTITKTFSSYVVFESYQCEILF